MRFRAVRRFCWRSFLERNAVNVARSITGAERLNGEPSGKGNKSWM